MLDAISDFWKPSKKQETSEFDPSQLNIGASIGFGFIPQSILSGKRATIQSINTYEFSGDRLTSFVLDVEGDTSISLIIADGQGEKYIALSRRIPFAERMRMLDNNELLACMDNAEQKRLNTKQPEGEWRNWLADSYKKAIHGLKGKLTTADLRGLSSSPDAADAKEFNYTLLVSNNNEYAIEIEQYNDNRIEVYATVYRRLTDMGEVKPADEVAVAALPAAPKTSSVASTAKELAALKPANDTVQKEAGPKLEETKQPQAAKPQLVGTEKGAKPGPVIESGKSNPKPLVLDSLQDLKSLQLTPPDTKEEVLLPDFEPVKAVVPTIQTLNQPSASLPKSEIKPAPKAEEKPVQAKPVETQPAEAEPASMKAQDAPVKEIPKTVSVPQVREETASTQKETDVMATYNASFNGKNESPASEVRTIRAIPGQQVDVENDVVECELRAANRVIEEAIRNEMRMSDVVRRIIALPVAQQEQVQIPVMLTDSDYHLLAIRYGIPAADRAAIKAKIVEEINDFSGSKRD